MLKQSQGVRIKTGTRHTSRTIASYVAAYALPLMASYSRVGVLCVGTDRSTGDSLGPITGTILRESAADMMDVWGTLDEPVHAVNLGAWVDGSARTSRDTLVIAVDACLGRAENVGTVRVGNGPLWPGAGVQKDLPPVGHMHITGTVNVGGFMEYFVLQNTRLGMVYGLAREIGRAILMAVPLLYSAPALEDLDDLSMGDLGEIPVGAAHGPELMGGLNAVKCVDQRADILKRLLGRDGYGQHNLPRTALADGLERCFHGEPGGNPVINQYHSLAPNAGRFSP